MRESHERCDSIAHHLNDLVVFYPQPALPGVSLHDTQVNMAGGIGFVDDALPCTLGNCPERHVPWGSKWIGKGSGMGGVYVDFNVPFDASLRATIRSHVQDLPGADRCMLQGVDFFGHDVVAKPAASVVACDALCNATSTCAVYTYRSAENLCMMKVRGPWDAMWAPCAR